MARKSVTAQATENRDRLAAMGAVAADFKTWRPQAEVLKEVEAVPTIWPAYDRLTGVGGHPTARLSVAHAPSNEGKAHRNGTPVLTPKGWVEIQDLQVGQEVVSADGKPCRVTGVYPRGVLELYEVEFSDGFKTVCCGEHLWFTTTTNERMRGSVTRGPRPEMKRIPTGVLGKGSVKSLAVISETLEEVHTIPVCGVVEFDRLGELPVDPYLLGLLLGDGGFTDPCVKFHKPEMDLCEQVVARLPGSDTGKMVEGGVRIRGGELRHRLTELGLYGCRSWEKFVPELYLRASPDDRLELLRGLLDTDGSVDKDGTGFEFSSTSDNLADSVVELARSLGAIVRDDDPRRTTYRSNGVLKTGRPSRRVKIVFTDNSSLPPVRSAKHTAKLRPRVRTQYRRIVEVRRVEPAEATCISVDSPDRLYVVEGYLVTHNSTFAVGLGLSFLMRGHFFGFADAERTTPQTYVRQLMGDYADHPGFSALPISTYEQARGSIREYCETISTARLKGHMPPDTTALVVLDSIRKLVPKKLWDELAKAVKADAEDEPKKRVSKFGGKAKGVDGAGGRAGQIKAAMNAAWVDELIPLLADHRIAMLIIARETVEDGEGFFADEVVTVGGGVAINYDSSLRLRMLRQFIHEDLGSEKKELVGERIRMHVMKTKVSFKEERTPSACFHVSNGRLCPEGFDLGRDCFELGLELGVVAQSGSNYRFQDVLLGKSARAALEKLHVDPVILRELEAAIRAVP